MNPEEYLRARGWKCRSADAWSKEWDTPDEFAEVFGVNEALALQLAEDRACYNFVRKRSAMQGGLLVEPGP